MKIGNLEFKDYAAKKPLSISATGKFLTPIDIADKPSLTLGSLFALSKDQQLKLALERYAVEPDFRLAIIGAGLLTKDEVIDQIKQQTEFGQLAVRAEMGYCNELIADLAGGTVPTIPPIPKVPLPPKPDWHPVKKCIWMKVINRVLFCENTTDSVTKPFAQYRMDNVHPVFKARGFNLIVLKGTDDVRANFIAPAKNALTVYISGIGHGNYTCYTGHWGDPILEVGHYDPAEVKDKGFHFLSCQTGRDLGPDTVSKGAKCYAGYTENFILQWDDGSTPAVNEFKLFAQSDSTFDITMANGASALDAYSATIQAFNAARALVPNTVAATYLTWDRDHLKLHGNGATKIQSYRFVKVCYPIKNPLHEDALAQAGELEDDV
jgi:hypothetical protein